MQSAAAPENQLKLSLLVLFSFIRTTDLLLLLQNSSSLCCCWVQRLSLPYDCMSFLVLLTFPLPSAAAPDVLVCYKSKWSSLFTHFSVPTHTASLLCKGTHCLRSYCYCCYEQFSCSVFLAWTFLPFNCLCCCCFFTRITFAALWEWVLFSMCVCVSIFLLRICSFGNYIFYFMLCNAAYTH